MHRREQIGTDTRDTHAFGRHTAVAHTAHTISTMPERSLIGFFLRGALRLFVTQSAHLLFRTACVLFAHGKLAEQPSHVLKNGYSRFLFPCHVFGCVEHPSSVSPDDALVCSADDLVRAVGLDTVGRVVVVVDKELFDGLLGVCVILYIVAQCETPRYGFIVRDPLAVD